MLYMFLAEGFEETEAIGTLDVIRRANIPVQTVGVTGKCVCGSHGVEIRADIEKSEIDLKKIDGVILPGGMPGTENLWNDADVISAVRHCAEHKLLLAAICAAPLIFGRLGLLSGHNAVCYPGYESELRRARIANSPAVTDRNIITAKGAGVSMLFGAKIVDWFKEGIGGEILAQMQHIRCE